MCWLFFQVDGPTENLKRMGCFDSCSDELIHGISGTKSSQRVSFHSASNQRQKERTNQATGCNRKRTLGERVEQKKSKAASSSTCSRGHVQSLSELHLPTTVGSLRARNEGDGGLSLLPPTRHRRPPLSVTTSCIQRPVGCSTYCCFNLLLNCCREMARLSE